MTCSTSAEWPPLCCLSLEDEGRDKNRGCCNNHKLPGLQRNVVSAGIPVMMPHLTSQNLLFARHLQCTMDVTAQLTCLTRSAFVPFVMFSCLVTFNFISLLKNTFLSAYRLFYKITTMEPHLPLTIANHVHLSCSANRNN